MGLRLQRQPRLHRLLLSRTVQGIARPVTARSVERTPRRFVLGRASTSVLFSSAMGFQVISGTPVQEFIEIVESATEALDHVRRLAELGSPNIRAVTESGYPCWLTELEGMAKFESDV
jgi:hypothetical protein